MYEVYLKLIQHQLEKNIKNYIRHYKYKLKFWGHFCLFLWHLSNEPPILTLI